MTNSGPIEPGWASVEACTLPSADRPLRMAEFDDLFATQLRDVQPRVGGTRARLLLAGDAGVADRVQRLVDAETSCCSFFTFTVLPSTGSTPDGPIVVLDIEVPESHAHVLAGLVARAEAARGGAW